MIKYKICICIFRLSYQEMRNLFPFRVNVWSWVICWWSIMYFICSFFLMYFKSVSLLYLKRVSGIISLWSYFVVFVGHALYCYVWYEVWFILLLFALIGLIACLHYEVFILRPRRLLFPQFLYALLKGNCVIMLFAVSLHVWSHQRKHTYYTCSCC